MWGWGEYGEKIRHVHVTYVLRTFYVGNMAVNKDKNPWAKINLYAIVNVIYYLLTIMNRGTEAWGKPGKTVSL